MKYMSNKKSFVWLGLIFLFLSLVIAGCGKNQANRTTVNHNVKTVVDTVGRKVEVPTTVKRIACLCPESGDAIAMLGQGNKIVAVVGGLKREVILTEMYPNVKNAYVPKGSGVINIEELVKSKPDLIFVKNDSLQDEREAQKLNETGIPWLVVTYNSMKEQQRAIEMIGQALGASSKAREYVKYYQDCINRVSQKVKTIPASQRVRIYHSINEATRTDAKNTMPADWTQAAGAINVSVSADLKLSEGNYYAGLEQILLWNPDVILCNENGVPNYIMTNSQWETLKAVKNHRVYQMPDGISRWGHPSSLETPLAVLWTAKTLYPDKFADVNMVSEVQYFYKKFFKLTITNDTAQKILSGTGMREARQ